MIRASHHTRRVDILHAHQPGTAMRPRIRMARQGSDERTKMQWTSGRWRESAAIAWVGGAGCGLGHAANLPRNCPCERFAPAAWRRRLRIAAIQESYPEEAYPISLFRHRSSQRQLKKEHRSPRLALSLRAKAYRAAHVLDQRFADRQAQPRAFV